MAGYSDTDLIQLWVQQKAPHQRRSSWLLAKEFQAFVGKPLAQVFLADVHAFAAHIASRRTAPQKAARTLLALKSLFHFGYHTGALPVNILPHQWPRVRRKQPSHKALAVMGSAIGNVRSALERRSRRGIPRQKSRPLRVWMGLALCVVGLGLVIPQLEGQEPPVKGAEPEIDPQLDNPHSWWQQQSHDRISALKLAYIRAFLDTIAWAEGTEGPDAYRIQYTGTKFSSFEDHPREIKCGWRYGQKLCSDAAGKYQFLSTSWDRMAQKIGAKDFSPKNQDRAAIAMLEEYGVLEDIEAGWFAFAAIKLIPVWPSFRDIGNGDRATAIARLEKVYQQKLAQYHPSSKAF